MKTGTTFTYVLLDKGTEDNALFDEIERLFQKLSISPKESVENYPVLAELKYLLRQEIEHDYF